MGALVEISEVSLAQPLPAAVHAGFLDQPRTGAVLDAEVVDVFGWALGSESEAVAVEFSSGATAIGRVPLGGRRPDLAEVFPERPDAVSAGFRTTIDLIGTPPEFELEISVVLADRRRARLATVRGHHRWRRQSSPAFAELASVAIACHGEAAPLAGAIEGVLAQGCPRLEIVVVADASAGDAPGVASRYPGVRCVGRGDDSGLAATRNLGIRATNGDFLVFLDAEDRLPPRALEAGLRALEQHPECAAALGPAGSAVPTVYRRSLFEHVRTFDPRLGAAAGLGFDLAVARRFPVAGLGEPAVADELAELLRKALATQVRRSLRERRFREALRETVLLARNRRG
jgi:Glycosyl transferase family 2